MREPHGPIGTSRPRPDSEPKVRGTVRYGADRRRDDALHARPVLATYAHARILGIDAAAALAWPGVVAVLTAADLATPTGDVDRLVEPPAPAAAAFGGPPV